MHRTQQLDDILQRCLDRIENGATVDACLRDYPTFASELVPLLEVAQELRALNIPSQRPASRVAVQERARTLLSARQHGPVWSGPANTWHHAGRMVWRYAVALAVIFALFGTSVAAAQDDLPGDMLYSVKLGSEQVRLGLARTPSQRAALYLTFAQRRLNECLALNEAERSLDGSLAAIKTEYARAWDSIRMVTPEEQDALVEQYHDALQHQQERLALALDDGPSASSRSTLQQVMDVMRDAQQRIGTLNGRPSPQPTPSGQQTGATPRIPASEATPTARATVTVTTATPVRTIPAVESRTVLASPSPRPGSTRPAEMPARTATLKPTERTPTPPEKQRPTQTTKPRVPISPTRDAGIPPRPSQRPTSVTHPSPRPTERPANTPRPEPTAERRTDVPTDTPEVIEPPTPTVVPSPDSLPILPTPEITEVSGSDVPTITPGEAEPTPAPPSPRPTNEHRPEPQPTSEHRPTPRPTNEHHPEPQPTNEHRPTPRPTNEHRP